MTLFAAGDVVERVPVWLGTHATVPLVAGRDLVVTMPRNWRKKASVKISYDTPIRAPVVKGTTLGKLAVTGEGVPQSRCRCWLVRTCPSWACQGAP